jgi:hypothetical protein
VAFTTHRAAAQRLQHRVWLLDEDKSLIYEQLQNFHPSSSVAGDSLSPDDSALAVGLFESQVQLMAETFYNEDEAGTRSALQRPLLVCVLVDACWAAPAAQPQAAELEPSPRRARKTRSQGESRPQSAAPSLSGRLSSRDAHSQPKLIPLRQRSLPVGSARFRARSLTLNSRRDHHPNQTRETQSRSAC